MTTSQYFVYRRPVAWTLLVATLAWGYFAYRAMPQRHDPIIPIRIATVVTIYPGADAEKVEREVTRKVERQVALCESVEKVRSLSRQNLSVVFIDLFDRVKNPEQVWQDSCGHPERMLKKRNRPLVLRGALHPKTHAINIVRRGHIEQFEIGSAEGALNDALGTEDRAQQIAFGRINIQPLRADVKAPARIHI